MILSDYTLWKIQFAILHLTFYMLYKGKGVSCNFLRCRILKFNLPLPLKQISGRSAIRQLYFIIDSLQETEEAIGGFQGELGLIEEIKQETAA